MKKIVTCLISILMIATLTIGISAENDTHSFEAITLNDLGLFNGTNKGFELDRKASRAEAAVMLVRLLGKEGDALKTDGVTPFTDLPSWAVKYVDYLYTNGLANGISATKFGPSQNISPNEYATFILRALGYNDKNGDFKWNEALDKAQDIGLIDVLDYYNLAHKTAALRDDVVLISYNALFCIPNKSTIVLIDSLIKSNVIKKASYEKASSRNQFMANSLTDLGYSVTYIPTAGDGIYGTSRDLTADEIASRAKDSIVLIETFDGDGNLITQGYGIVMAKDYILTNNQVITYASSVTVTFADGMKLKAIGVISESAWADLSLLQLEANNYAMVSIKQGDSSKLQNDEKIYAYGNPKGLTISEGFIRPLNIKIEGYSVNLEHFTTSTSSGSTGGALLNSKGELIGITSIVHLDTQNINIVVPVNLYKTMHLIEFRPFVAKPSPTTPSDVPFDTGIHPPDLSEDLVGSRFDFDYTLPYPIQESQQVKGAIQYAKDKDAFSIVLDQDSNFYGSILYSDVLLAEYVHLVIEDSNGKIVATYDGREKNTLLFESIKLKKGTYTVYVYQDYEYKAVWNGSNIYVFSLSW